MSPDWARRPAGLQVQSAPGRSERGAPRRDSGHGRERDGREPGRPAARPRAEARKPFNVRAARPERPPVPSRDEAARGRIELPILISFIPERRGLGPIADWLAGTRKAHSIESVAAMFLSKPDYFAVKLESASMAGGAEPVRMYQCSLCKAVFLEKDAAAAHVLAMHLDLFYKKEEVQVDPPKGNFQCVAQCRLSGELLGPPNYHGYNERVQEIHKAKFPNMPTEEYRKHIVNRKEPELLDEWKSGVCRQIRYSTIEPAAPETFFRRADVDDHFIRKHADGVVKEGRRCIVPGTVIMGSSVTQLAAAVHDSWRREKRFSSKMGRALQPAFKHLGLHVFKAGDKIPYVTAIRPNYLAPGHTTEDMRKILDRLESSPLNSRLELIGAVQPGIAPDSPGAAEIISRLCWLVERGHIIEFFDGRLMVPQRRAVP